MSEGIVTIVARVDLVIGVIQVVGLCTLHVSVGVRASSHIQRLVLGGVQVNSRQKLLVKIFLIRIDLNVQVVVVSLVDDHTVLLTSVARSGLVHPA